MCRRRGKSARQSRRPGGGLSQSDLWGGPIVLPLSSDLSWATRRVEGLGAMSGPQLRSAMALVLVATAGGASAARSPPASLRGGSITGRVSNLYVGGLPVSAQPAKHTIGAGQYKDRFPMPPKHWRPVGSACLARATRSTAALSRTF